MKAKWKEMPSSRQAAIAKRRPLLIHHSWGNYYDLEVRRIDGIWYEREIKTIRKRLKTEGV